jgi:hypothetical protein
MGDFHLCRKTRAEIVGASHFQATPKPAVCPSAYKTSVNRGYFPVEHNSNTTSFSCFYQAHSHDDGRAPPPLLTITASSPATVVTDHVLPADLPCCLASRISFLDADVDRAISALDLLPRLCSPPHRRSRWAKNAAPKSTTPNQRVNPPWPKTKVDEYFTCPLLLYAFDV